MLGDQRLSYTGEMALSVLLWTALSVVSTCAFVPPIPRRAALGQNLHGRQLVAKVEGQPATKTRSARWSIQCQHQIPTAYDIRRRRSNRAVCSGLREATRPPTQTITSASAGTTASTSTSIATNDDDETPSSRLGQLGETSTSADRRREEYRQEGAGEGEGLVGGDVDLFARTWESLDFGVVLDRLSRECRTNMGRSQALIPDFKTTLEEVHELYESVNEVLRLPAEAVPLRASMGVEAEVALARSGTILEPNEIADVASALEGLCELREWFCGAQDERKNAADYQTRKASTPRLTAVAEQLTLDEGLLGLLRGAFDNNGELCARRFPEIGRLRQKVDTFKRSIKATMERLMASGEFAGMLAEGGRGAYVSEIAGRFVIPVLPTYKRTVGIVHDSSRTGKTLFVEPSQVVGPTNELMEAKLALKVETQRILSQMTRKIAENGEDILLSLAKAAELDLIFARGRLSHEMEATIPTVRNEGAISLTNARHPVLLLRGKQPVGNDMALNEKMQSLVLTGPNAGGKTVVLKTLGLVALMVRAGIPVPAAQGARVDLFDPVLADIGDLQSVTGDLSTFSGHLMVAKAVLSKARGGSLILMDEMGSGTDPMQGAALAEALLEALLDAGARVALTTHYTQLKELAARDDRFGVAAMQFVNGRPTYRLVQGAIGESFALQVAERLELPAFVVERARSLLDENTRQVSELIKKLEAEREELRKQTERAAAREKEVALQLEKLAKERAEAAELRSSAKREAAKEYAIQIEINERKMKQMFEEARRRPTTEVIGARIGEIRALKAEVEEQAAEPVRFTAEDLGLTPLKKRDKLKQGEKVVVCAGSCIGWEGEVSQTSNRDAEIYLPSAGASMRFAITQLSRMPIGGVKWPQGVSANQPTPAAGTKTIAPSARGVKTSRRVAQYLESDVTSFKTEKGGDRGGDRGNGTNNSRKGDDGNGGGGGSVRLFRTSSNTIDLRGMTLSEACDECDMFFSVLIMDGAEGCYLLHGHGTGALKAGLRRWLPRNSMARKWMPAGQGDGGDAFTVVLF